jgi:hypothetical protein
MQNRTVIGATLIICPNESTAASVGSEAAFIKLCRRAPKW